METITIGSAVTEDRLYFLYILMNSIKAHKRAATRIDYYVFVPFTAEKDELYYRKYFSELQSDTFKIYPMNVNPVIYRMGKLPGPVILYVRCFFPQIFSSLDKILYLDSDVLCSKPGIEEYWNTDITDCYAAVSQDPAIMWTERYQFERDNTGLTRYFNSGIMLLNLAEIRKRGLDKVLVDWLQNWHYDILQPHHHDQTLMNWLFKDHLKWLPWTYNNHVLTAWGYKIESYERQAKEDGYDTPLDTLKDTLFHHFVDHSKPWLRLPYPDSAYPYIKESRAIWFDATSKYAKRETQITDSDSNISIVSTTTTDRLDKVYVLLNSIKKTKQRTTNINYYLFVRFTEDMNYARVSDYFADLQSSDFNIQIRDVDCFKSQVNQRERDHIYYAKCLLASHFDLDRILFLDVDLVFVRPGIEALWNSDITDYYLGAVVDPTWQYCAAYKQDRLNTKTDHYFNAGVILFNLAKLREDGKDKQLEEWCARWHSKELAYICYDQTLLNYLLKDKAKLLSFGYNNTLLASLGVAKISYTYCLNQYGYLNPLDSIDNAVIVHFCGQNKPWSPSALHQPLSEYPYKEEAVQLWHSIETKYGKR